MENFGLVESPAFVNLRKKSARFWKKVAILTEKRIQNPFVFQTAMEDLRREEMWQIPVVFRKSFEAAAWKAQRDFLLAERGVRSKHRERTLAAFSSKGGRAKRSNPFNELIETLVRENPKISEHDLRAALKKRQGNGVIISVNNQTVRYFKNGEEMMLTGPALRNRLSRAKKRAKKHSREPVDANAQPLI